MRRVVVLLLLLLSPLLAQASGLRLHPEPIALQAGWPGALPFAPQLRAPCLACQRSKTVSVSAGVPHLLLAEPAPAARFFFSQVSGAAVRPRVTAQRPATRSRRVIAIGDSWRLAHGREFSIRLTPTQEECAPLVRLTF
jgi:hypothetical protein